MTSSSRAVNGKSISRRDNTPGLALMGCRGGFRPRDLCHSFDKTDESVAHLSQDKKPASSSLLLGHTNLESTVRYLGIEVDDALEMSEQTEV